MAVVTIKVRENGPFRLIDTDGVAYELPEGDTVALCRCGRSATKPFCDKTHQAICFDATERAAG